MVQEIRIINNLCTSWVNERIQKHNYRRTQYVINTQLFTRKMIEIKKKKLYFLLSTVPFDICFVWIFFSTLHFTIQNDLIV